MVKRSRIVTGNMLLAAFITSLVALTFVVGCQKNEVNTPDDITVDLANKGSLSGRVTVPTISQNHLAYKGLKLATISLESTEFSTQSVIEGEYSMSSIPSGSYTLSVKAGSPYYDWYDISKKAVTIIKQQNTDMGEIRLMPNIQVTSVIYGKLLDTNGNPITGKKLYVSDQYYIADSTITSSDGSYGFAGEEIYGPYYFPDRFFVRNGTITVEGRSDSRFPRPFKGVVQKNLTFAPQ